MDGRVIPAFVAVVPGQFGSHWRVCRWEPSVVVSLACIGDDGPMPTNEYKDPAQQAHLGLATTRQLADELAARMANHGGGASYHPDYTTVGGEMRGTQLEIGVEYAVPMSQTFVSFDADGRMNVRDSDSQHSCGTPDTSRGELTLSNPKFKDSYAGSVMADGADRARGWAQHEEYYQNDENHDVMGWRVVPPANITEAVGQAIGAGSTCFEPGTVPSGVFDDRRARTIVDQLLGEIEKFADALVHNALQNEREKTGKLQAALNDPWEDVAVSGGNVDYAPKRFEVELVPTQAGVYVNGIGAGTVTLARTGEAVVRDIRGARVKGSDSLAGGLLALVRDAATPGTDKPTERDLSVSWLVELGSSGDGANVGGGHGDEIEDD